MQVRFWYNTFSNQQIATKTRANIKYRFKRNTLQQKITKNMFSISFFVIYKLHNSAFFLSKAYIIPHKLFFPLFKFIENDLPYLVIPLYKLVAEF